MTHAMRLAGGLLAVLCAPARADLWIVDAAGGPGSDFTDVQAAVDAAADGDVILVRAGEYAGVTIDDKALTLAADGGPAELYTLTVQNLAVTRTVQLSGLVVQSPSFDPSCILQNNAGALLVEDCEIRAAVLPPFRGGEAVAISSCARVVFSDCLLLADTTQIPRGYPGVRVTSSAAAFYGCEVHGGTGEPGSIFPVLGPGKTGGPGLALSGASSVLVSDGLLIGGRGGTGGSTITPPACSDAGGGGVGVALGAGAPTLRLLGTSVQGGPGGVAPGACTDGQPGDDFRVISGVVENLAASARRFAVPSPLREGDALSLDFEGQPGDALLLFVSLTQDPVYLSLGSGTLVPQEPIYLALQDVVPAGGSLSIPLVLAELGPGIESFGLFEQPVFFNASDGFVLGTPRHVLHLDGAVP